MAPATTLTGSTYRVLNPATGEITRSYPSATDQEIESALRRAHGAARRERIRAAADRTDELLVVAALLRERALVLASIIAEEMGKPVTQGISEVEFSADIFEYYARNAPGLTADEPIPSSASGRAVLQKRPLGPLVGIMPWNYPYYQIARFAAPNLALGNTVLVKPSEWCPRSAIALEELLTEAGVPEGTYQSVLATHDQVRMMIADPRVQGVSLTGSERAGSAVAAIAGEHLKKVVLELGGSDAYVVLDTESVADAAEAAWAVRMENMGQACNSNKRIIVAQHIFDEFVTELVQLASSLRPGDPLHLSDAEYPPLAARSAAVHLEEVVADAVSKGAALHAGGQVLDGRGAYFSPAVLTGVTPDMRAYHEELFGPVAVVYCAGDDENALRLANDTEYGLGAAVFSTDPVRAARFAKNLEVGMVSINAASAERAEFPFGGVKRSGFGRELGPLGMDEFVNRRLVYVA
jgi:succinate-semialdehyde dehydrogenase/glutarate-semialdehyde dehydrogenase